MTLAAAFSASGVDSERSLEAMLKRFGSGRSVSGSPGFEYVDRSGRDFDLAERLCRYFSDALKTVESSTAGPGIQQFSIINQPRLGDGNVGKALLLSRTSTMLTPHRLEYESYSVFAMDDASTYSGRSWSISPDFMRDAYRYAELIDGSDLLVLPSEVSYLDAPYKDDPNDTSIDPPTVARSRDLQLLQELAATRVINLPVSSGLLDAIIERYRRNRQLVVLPELQLSTIDNLPLADLVQVRSDSRDELDAFQRVYHGALLDQIANCRDLDFARISAQIQGDVLDPAVRRIEQRYRRIMSLHSRLARSGAAATLLPLGSVVVSGSLFGQLLSEPAFSAMLGSLAGLAITVYTNRIHRRDALDALGDETYFVLWRLTQHGPRTRAGRRGWPWRPAPRPDRRQGP